MELRSPLLGHIAETVGERPLAMCEAVFLEFSSILELVAGEREKGRAKELLQRIQ